MATTVQIYIEYTHLHGAREALLLITVERVVCHHRLLCDFDVYRSLHGGHINVNYVHMVDSRDAP